VATGNTLEILSTYKISVRHCNKNTMQGRVRHSLEDNIKLNKIQRQNVGMRTGLNWPAI
jgi:hypothetical protein